MRLKSVKLKNIRSYVDETIEFPEGSVLLSGDIGSGKSTILLALEFGIFGLLKGQISPNQLLRHGAKEGSINLSFNVNGKELEIFRKLKRGSAIKQEPGYIDIDGERMHGTSTELKSKILEILGYPESLLTKSKSLIFRYTVYTPQEDMKQILYEKPEERLITLRKLFNIDKYQRIIENSKLFLTDLKRKNQVEAARTEGKKDVENKIKELIISKNEVEGKFSKKKEEFDLINKENNETLLKFRETEKKILEHQETERQHAVMESQLKGFIENIKSKNLRLSELKEKINSEEANLKKITNSLSQKITNYNEDKHEEQLLEKEKLLQEHKEDKKTQDQNKETHQKLENEHNLLTENIKNIENRIKEKENQISTLKKEVELENELKSRKVDNVDDKIKLLKEEIDKIQQEITKEEKEFSKYNTLKEESSKLIAQIRSIDQCPTCNQNVDESYKERIRAEESAKNSAIDRRLESCEKKLESYREKITKFDKLQTEQYKIKEEQGLINEKLKNILIKKEELEKHKLENESIIKKLNEFKTNQEKLNLDIKKLNLDPSKILKLNETIEKLSNEIFELKKDISEIKNLNKNLQDRNLEIKQITKDFENIDEQRSSLEKELQLSAEKLEETNTLRDEYSKLKLNLENLSVKLEGVKGECIQFEENIKNKKMIIEEKKEELNKIKQIIKKIEKNNEIHHFVKEYFIPTMYNIEQHMMIQIHRQFSEYFNEWFDRLIEDQSISVRLSEDYTPIIEQNGYETYVENLSGGEKTSVALAYRLALNKVVTDYITNINTKDLLILDEPTDGFSSEQLDRIREVLDAMNTKQMLIVSHEPKLESYVQNVIKISKNSSESKITN